MPPYTAAQRARYAQQRTQPAQRPRPTYRPSAYQQAIIDWLLNDDGNGIVVAKAGSGKTSTLCMLSDCIPQYGSRAAFLAFNKSIADELKTRLPSHVQAATFHSVCMGALRRLPECEQYSNSRTWVQANKVHTILDSLTGQFMNLERMRQGIVRLIGMMKANALLPDCDSVQLYAIIEHFEIEFDERQQDGGVAEAIEIARLALTINNAELSSIDFDDMLYLCAIMGAPVQRYSHLFVDEAQDTNTVQRILIARMIEGGGRLIAVGDESQAIYGFRGADSEAMSSIRDTFRCKTFPLSISYRCPTSVIKLAQTIVPDIEARPDAPEGTVEYLKEWTVQQFTALDLVVCRNVAPVVSLAFKFLRNHMPVKVMGREIGEQLVALIQKMKARDLNELADKIDEYTDAEVKKALYKRQEAKAERLNDQRDSVIAIIEGLPMDQQSVYDVIAIIRRLFTNDSEGNRTTLATVHKAKGMEAHRVFILDPQLMPSPWATQPWQMQQEQNLRYVAITRSLDTLYFLESDAIE